MQRKLTSQLAAMSGLEVISFQHFDCLVFERSETLKMFRPQSKRLMGGTAKDKMIIGDLMVIFKQDIEPLHPPSARFKITDWVTYAPIANFPSITISSILVDGLVARDFFRQIDDLLKALPDKKSEWTAKFGENFFALTQIDRCVDTVAYLRTFE
jgi:hypothetical protein